MKKLLLTALVTLGTLASAATIPELKKECTAGKGSSCASLGAVYAGFGKNTGVTKDMAKASEYWKRGCDLDNGSSCVTYSLVLEDEAEKMAVLKKSCDLKNENGCITYNYMLEMDRLKPKCMDQADGRSCGELGELLAGSGDVQPGFDVIDVACGLGDKVSCENDKKIKAFSDYGSLSFVNKLKVECMKDEDKVACERVGNFLISSTEIIISSAKTKEEKTKVAKEEVMPMMLTGLTFLKKACELGRRESCRSYKGIMAKIGG